MRLFLRTSAFVFPAIFLTVMLFTRVLPAPAAHVVAYNGMCGSLRGGTCLTDLNTGLSVYWLPYGTYVSQWSADMRVNTYVSPFDQGIYSHEWGDGERSVVNDYSARLFTPALSADTTQITFAIAMQGTPSVQLRAINRDGTDNRLLTTVDLSRARFAGSLSWSPDGRYVTYFLSEPSPVSTTFSPVLNLLDTTTRAVTAVGSVSAPAAAWSPDGAWVAYVPPNQDTIEIVEATTGSTPERIRALNEAAGHNIIGDFISWVRFSPDSEHLLFIDRNPDNDTTLVRVRDLTTGEVKTLTTFTGADRRFEDVLWRDDGILIMEDLQPASTLDLIIFHHVDPDTGERTAIGRLHAEDYIRMVTW